MSKVASSIASQGASAPQWRRFKFPGSLLRYIGLLAAVAFVSLSISYLNIPLDRFIGMFGRIGALISDRYYPPDIAYIADRDYLHSVFETIQMAYLGALFGMLVAIPLGWFGAYNVTPNRFLVYPLARLTTMSARAVHETIWAILFVTIPRVRDDGRRLCLDDVLYGFRRQALCRGNRGDRHGSCRGHPGDWCQRAPSYDLRDLSTGTRRLYRHCDLHLGM